jgi:hypothetical protein
MKIRKSVFGSAYERALYKALVTRWSDKLRIYPNLPFLNIIEVNESDVPSNERNFLLKTSVDYTVCDESDQPLLSIEFDGIGEGFSRQAEYVPRYVSTKDPNREWKLNLKLRVCQELEYPLFIISYEEATPIGADLHLAILDGIIGRYMTSRNLGEAIDELYQQSDIDELPRHVCDEAIQDLVLEAETALEFEWNPIIRKAYELEATLWGKGFCGGGERYEWLDEPGTPPAPRDWLDVEGFRQRIEALKKAKRAGCRHTLRTSLGEVSAEAWIRNIEGHGVSPVSLVHDIAELLAAKKALSVCGLWNL